MPNTHKWALDMDRKEEINNARINIVEDKQSVTERNVEKIEKHLYDSRRDVEYEPEPITMHGSFFEEEPDGQPFTGIVYVKGNKVDLTADTAKKWVKVNLNSASASYEDGPPTDPFPANEEWYEVSATSGDIHLP